MSASSPEAIKKKRARTEAWRAAHPEAVRRYRRKNHLSRYHIDKHVRDERRYLKVYGVKKSRKAELFAAQGNKCAICGRTKPPAKGWHLDADHDQTPPLIRGVLCSPCNLSIGQFGHSIPVIEAAARYLKDRCQ